MPGDNLLFFTACYSQWYTYIINACHHHTSLWY